METTVLVPLIADNPPLVEPPLVVEVGNVNNDTGELVVMNLFEVPVEMVGIEHVIGLTGPQPRLGSQEREDYDNTVIERKARIDSLKTAARFYGGKAVRDLILVAAKSRNMPIVVGHPQVVMTWEEVCQSYSKCPTPIPLFLEKIMFFCMYGIFDQNFKWDIVMEIAFMKAYGLIYDRSTPTYALVIARRPSFNPVLAKGCFAKVFNNVKTDVVKQMQKCSKPCFRHGWYIAISRPSLEITKENKYKKRKKGEQYYVRRHGGPREGSEVVALVSAIKTASATTQHSQFDHFFFMYQNISCIYRQHLPMCLPFQGQQRL